MNLNAETERLCTFDLWPLNVYLEDMPRIWARNGFFAVTDSEAECNWCHQRLSARCNQIEERHRLLQPLCPFILDSQACGNEPIDLCITNNQPVTSDAGSDVSSQNVNLLVEADRLTTFKNWPNPNISPESLAKAGFFYLNRSDEVKCVWCKGVIARWEKHDDAFEEHKRFFPDCPRVQLGPLIEMASDGIQNLGIQQVSAPKKPKFSSLDARLRTYTNWPIGDIQKPESLAQSGLYYQNVDDHVRCFHCNIGLRSWQKEDDPWFEHAKWYPQCHFVRLAKGANYIFHVQEMVRKLARNDGITMSIDEAMSTPPVLQALEIGIDGGSIRNATQRRLSNNGRPYSTVEDLIKAIFSDQNLDDDAVERIYTTQIDFSSIESDYRIPVSSITSTSIEVMSSPTIVNAAAIAAEEDQMKKKISEKEQEAIDVLGKNSPSRRLSLEEENRKLKDARLCKVCLDDEVGVVFLPCGHLVTCVQCASGISQCPMCRTIIKGFVRTYLS